MSSCAEIWVKISSSSSRTSQVRSRKRSNKQTLSGSSITNANLCQDPTLCKEGTAQIHSCCYFKLIFSIFMFVGCFRSESKMQCNETETTLAVVLILLADKNQTCVFVLIIFVFTVAPSR